MDLCVLKICERGYSLDFFCEQAVDGFGGSGISKMRKATASFNEKSNSLVGVQGCLSFVEESGAFMRAQVLVGVSVIVATAIVVVVMVVVMMLMVVVSMCVVVTVLVVVIVAAVMSVSRIIAMHMMVSMVMIATAIVFVVFVVVILVVHVAVILLESSAADLHLRRLGRADDPFHTWDHTYICWNSHRLRTKRSGGYRARGSMRNS